MTEDQKTTEAVAFTAQYARLSDIPGSRHFLETQAEAWVAQLQAQADARTPGRVTITATVEQWERGVFTVAERHPAK